VRRQNTRLSKHKCASGMIGGLGLERGGAVESGSRVCVSAATQEDKARWALATARTRGCCSTCSACQFGLPDSQIPDSLAPEWSPRSSRVRREERERPVSPPKRPCTHRSAGCQPSSASPMPQTHVSSRSSTSWGRQPFCSDCWRRLQRRGAAVVQLAPRVAATPEWKRRTGARATPAPTRHLMMRAKRCHCREEVEVKIGHWWRAARWPDNLWEYSRRVEAASLPLRAHAPPQSPQVQPVLLHCGRLRFHEGHQGKWPPGL
jgi:hypothetical protein